MNHAFDDVVFRLYSASTNPSEWASAFRGLEDLTGSAGATLNFVPRVQNISGRVLSGRFTEDVCEEYARDYMMICPRVQAGIRNPGPELQYDYKIITEQEMDRDPVYNWFGSLGLRYSIAMNLMSDERFGINFSLQRQRSLGHVQDEDIELFLRIVPHIKQAVRIASHTQSLERQLAFSKVILEHSAHAIFIIDSAAGPRFMNLRAQRLLSTSSDVAIRQGRLCFPINANASASLAKYVTEFASQKGDAGGWPSNAGGWLSVERPDRSPLMIEVLPIVGEAVNDVIADAIAMIIIHDPEAVKHPSERSLQDVFGLTPMEARVALLIARGERAEAIARTLSQSRETTRSHIKSIFSKTGVSRQVELVRLVNSFTSTI